MIESFILKSCLHSIVLSVIVLEVDGAEHRLSDVLYLHLSPLRWNTKFLGRGCQNVHLIPLGTGIRSI